MMIRRICRIVILVVPLALGAACTPVRTPMPASTDTAPASPALTRAPTLTPTATITVFSSPTSEPALPSYPNIILPGRERLRDIFTAGVRNGMRRGIFSKVGDSITANGVFLVPFGMGNYSLGAYGYLEEVIAFYLRENAREGNSFIHDSFAARTSWRAEHVLDPSRARSPCEAGETPLLCEYRIVRPAAAVILLGTNDAMSPTGTYEASMRRIVILSLNRGIIPILTTLPDQRGKDVGPYNAVIRSLAADWELPLIDLSSALASLPQQGLTPDGVHLSWLEPAVFEPPYLKYGMTVRNLLTLQALDAVWRSFTPDK
jgi:hypothetical protein